MANVTVKLLGSEFQSITNSQDREAVLESIAGSNWQIIAGWLGEYQTLFVRVDNCEIAEVYGSESIAPAMTDTVDTIVRHGILQG